MGTVHTLFSHMVTVALIAAIVTISSMPGAHAQGGGSLVGVGSSDTGLTFDFSGLKELSDKAISDVVQITGGGTTTPSYAFDGCRSDVWKAMVDGGIMGATSMEKKYIETSAAHKTESTFSLFRDGSGNIIPCNDITKAFTNVGILFDPTALLNGFLQSACQIAQNQLQQMQDRMMNTLNEIVKEELSPGLDGFVFNPGNWFFANIPAGAMNMPGLRVYPTNGLLPDFNYVPVPTKLTVQYPNVIVNGVDVTPWKKKPGQN